MLTFFCHKASRKPAVDIIFPFYQSTIPILRRILVRILLEMYVHVVYVTGHSKNLSFLKWKKIIWFMKWLNPIIMHDIKIQDRYGLALSNSTKCSKIYHYLLFQKSRKPYTYRCAQSQIFRCSCFLNHKEKFFWSEVGAVR